MIKTADEYYQIIKNMKSPDEIFDVYNYYFELSKEQQELFDKKYKIGDALEMEYETALRMKDENQWNDYVEIWNNRRNDNWRKEQYIKILNEIMRN